MGPPREPEAAGTTPEPDPGGRPTPPEAPDPLDVAKDAFRKLTAEMRRQFVVWLLSGMH